MLEGEWASLRMTPDGDLFVTEYGGAERMHPYLKPETGFKGDSVKAAQEHCAACLLGGEPSESEGEEYLKTVAAVFACYESAEQGRLVRPSGFLRG